MKSPHLWLAALALTLPASVQADPHSHPTTSFKSAVDTWAEVRSGLQELDGLIATKKLSGVHDSALNLRDTVRELRFGWDGLPPQQREKADGSIRKIDSLLDDLHESADSNNPRLVAKNQRTLHVLLDQIATAFPIGTLKPMGPIVTTSTARDPFCRMTVDPATAAATQVVNGQTYYFCSKNEATAFAKNPAPYIALYDELAFGKPREYTLAVAAPRKLPPSQPAQLAFSVREKGQSQLTKNFQLVHEKLMHLIIVSDDLSWFAHEHPALTPDGRFYIKQSFPHSGKYHLYGDFTPSDGTNQVLSTQVSVGDGITRKPIPLQPDTSLQKTIDGLAVQLKLSKPLTAGNQSVLTYTLSKAGSPYTGMKPYLGAMGHMMAISQDGKQVVHTHSVSAGTDPETGITVSPTMSTASGPSQSFKLTLPTSGLYRVWAQFNAGDKVLTVPFTFKVQPNPMKIKSASALTLAGAALATSAVQAKPAAPVQKITVNLPGGYREGAGTVKPGHPIALTFKLTQDAGCGNVIAVPAAKWTKTLKPGQSATVTVPAPTKGPLKYECGMGMFKGSLQVKK